LNFSETDETETSFPILLGSAINLSKSAVITKTLLSTLSLDFPFVHFFLVPLMEVAALAIYALLFF
jgi:hypothetical protein